MATAEQIVHVSEFTNEPFIDFAKAENRSRMEEALKKVKAEFGREYPMWLNGKKVTTTEKRTSTNPSRPAEVIGVFQNATVEMARQAVEDANKFFDTWKRVPSQERAKFLFGAAQVVRERKYELNALVCYEVGKTWVEADADIAETIDFLEFYGREMLRLGEPQKLTPMRGERNYLVYIPLGVGVVIPPWNFPCAIMAGLVCASAVRPRRASGGARKRRAVFAVHAAGLPGQPACRAACHAAVERWLRDAGHAAQGNRCRRPAAGQAQPCLRIVLCGVWRRLAGRQHRGRAALRTLAGRPDRLCGRHAACIPAAVRRRATAGNDGACAFLSTPFLSTRGLTWRGSDRQRRQKGRPLWGRPSIIGSRSSGPARKSAWLAEGWPFPPARSCDARSWCSPAGPSGRPW